MKILNGPFSWSRSHIITLIVDFVILHISGGKICYLFLPSCLAPPFPPYEDNFGCLACSVEKKKDKSHDYHLI